TVPVVLAQLAQGGRQEIMIASVVRIVAESDRQVAARPAVLAPAQLDLAQANLRLLGHLAGQFAETGQPGKNCQGVAGAAKLLVPTTHQEKTIHQVERPAHGAASVPIPQPLSVKHPCARWGRENAIITTRRSGARRIKQAIVLRDATSVHASVARTSEYLNACFFQGLDAEEAVRATCRASL